MGLKGKMSVEKEINCHGDVFHDLFKHKPHHISNAAPNLVHRCDLHEGEFGAVGSILSWEYTHEGKRNIYKVVTEVIDEEKKYSKFRGLEGSDVLKLYKEYNIIIQVDTNGDNHVVKWTIEYEKANEDVPDPISQLKFTVDLLSDIEAHHTTK